MATGSPNMQGQKCLSEEPKRDIWVGDNHVEALNKQIKDNAYKWNPVLNRQVDEEAGKRLNPCISDAGAEQGEKKVLEAKRGKRFKKGRSNSY